MEQATEQEKLEKILSRTKETPAGCREWIGALVGPNSPYGRVRFEGKASLTHRVVYILCKGSIPEGMVVRHKCDNPKCVNPEHLETGTPHENTQDKMERGRYRGGFGPLVLNYGLVREIRRRSKAGQPIHSIAREMGLKYSTTRGVVAGLSWRWVL